MGTKYLQPYMHGFFMDWSWQRSMSRTNECFPRSDSEVCCKLSDVRIIGSMPSWRLLSTPLRLRSTGSRRPQRRKQLQKHMSHEKNINRLFQAGRDRESKIASRKVAKAHVMILFFSSRHAGLCLRIFGQEGTLADDCIRFQLTAKEPQKSQDSRKGRERCKAPSRPVSLQSLHAPSHIFSGENLSFSSLLYLLSISSFLFLFLSCSSDGRMRCVKRRWANTLHWMPDLIGLYLFHVTSGFPLSPRKVRERDYCSRVFAQGTAVAAKVKQKDSRKTLLSTKSWGSAFSQLT